MNGKLLFVCPHGAAKSILAAAYAEYLAKQCSLNLEVGTGGTEPDAAIAPAVAALLHSEGIPMTDKVPHTLTQFDIDSAQRVVSLGCSLEHFDLGRTTLEQWDDVPLPSKDLGRSRDAIYARVERLIAQLQDKDQL